MLIEHIADTDNYNEEAIKGIEKEIKTLETKLKDVKKARSKSLAGESTDYSVGMDRAKKRASDAAKKLGKAISNSPSAGKDLAKGLTSQAWGFIKSSPEKFAKWKKGDKPNIDGLYSLKDLNLDDADALDRIQKESSKMLAELTELNKEIPVLREEQISVD